MFKIFILELHDLLRNVVTDFSQLHFFLVFRLLRNIFTVHLLMFIDNFFIRKIKHFATNWWDRFLKYISIVQIYGTLETAGNSFRDSQFKIGTALQRK